MKRDSNYEILSSYFSDAFIREQSQIRVTSLKVFCVQGLVLSQQTKFSFYTDEKEECKSFSLHLPEECVCIGEDLASEQHLKLREEKLFRTSRLQDSCRPAQVFCTVDYKQGIFLYWEVGWFHSFSYFQLDFFERNKKLLFGIGYFLQ